MTKQTKMLLGLAAVAGVGYYGYTQWKKSKTSGFANVSGKRKPKKSKSKATPLPSTDNPFEYTVDNPYEYTV